MTPSNYLMRMSLNPEVHILYVNSSKLQINNFELSTPENVCVCDAAWFCVVATNTLLVLTFITSI